MNIYNYNSGVKYDIGLKYYNFDLKKLYDLNIFINDHDYFNIKFKNIFSKEFILDDPNRYKGYNYDVFRVWSTQLNFAIFLSTAACGISVEHLNSKYNLAKSFYLFHIYYQVNRILYLLDVSIPGQPNFNSIDNNYNKEKLAEYKTYYGISKNNFDYREILHIPDNHLLNNYNVRLLGRSLYHKTLQVPDNHLLNNVGRLLLRKSLGFSKIGIELLSESVRIYSYLILTSQVEARSSIIGNGAKALSAQHAFLENFNDVINRREDIGNDIKKYEDLMKYASSKIDYSVGQNIYMLPSDMNLNIGGKVDDYNNKIFISKDNVIGVRKENKDKRIIINKNKEKSIVEKNKDKNKDKDIVINKDKSIVEKNKDKNIKNEQKSLLVMSIVGIFSIYHYLSN